MTRSGATASGQGGEHQRPSVSIVSGMCTQSVCEAAGAPRVTWKVHARDMCDLILI